jgi:hypothetical protein
MKKIIIFLMFAFGYMPFSFGQQANPPVPMVDGKVNFNEVVPVEGVKKDVLYGRAKMWIINTFLPKKNDADQRTSRQIKMEDVIQLDDRENGIIVLKGNIGTNIEDWMFQTKIQIRDEKYKVEFFDIIKRYYPNDKSASPSYSNIDLDKDFTNTKLYKPDGTLKGLYGKVAEEANKFFKDQLKSLKMSMTESSSDF